MTRVKRLRAIVVLMLAAMSSSLITLAVPLRAGACGTSVDGQCVVQSPPPTFVETTPDAYPVYVGTGQTFATTTTANALETVGSASLPWIDPTQPVSSISSINGVQAKTDTCCLHLGNGGDACVAYTCDDNTESWWFVVGNWNTDPGDPSTGTGAASGGVLQPKFPPNDGHFYFPAMTTNEVQPPSGNPNNMYVCDVYSWVKAYGNDNVYAIQMKPNGTTYTPTGNSTTTTVGVALAPGFHGSSGTIGLSKSWTTTDTMYNDGGWDADYHNYGVSEYYDTNNNLNCPQSSISDTGAVIFDFDATATGSLNATFGLGWNYLSYNN